MKNIEMELYRFETLVFGKINYVNPELLKGDVTLVKNEEYRIKTSLSPEIRADVLYVWGNDEGANDDVIYNNFADEDEAIKYCECIKNLIDKVNNELNIEEETKIKRVI